SSQTTAKVLHPGSVQLRSWAVGVLHRWQDPITLGSSEKLMAMRSSNTYSEPSQSPSSPYASSYRTMPPSIWYSSWNPRLAINTVSTSHRMPPVQYVMMG